MLKTQKYFEQNHAFSSFNGKIIYSEPHSNIYSFSAILQWLDNTTLCSESISLDNTMWSSTVLAAGHIKAMVIYVGQETRSVLNSRKPRSKVSKMDQKLNWIGKALFLLMVIAAISLVIFSGRMDNFFLKTMRYLVLLTSILPISMKTSLEVAKLWFTWKISTDRNMKGTLARNTNIPDELGRVSFALMDKTGTLTANFMHFKKMCFFHLNQMVTFTYEETKTIKGMIQQEEQRESLFSCFMKIYDGETGAFSERFGTPEKRRASFGESNMTSMGQGSIRRSQTEALSGSPLLGSSTGKGTLLRQLTYSLAICHNVLTLEEDGEVFYQAASPDEIALISMAKSFGIKLLERTQTKMKILNSEKKSESMNILEIFPFSSETKQMGIVVEIESTGHNGSELPIIYFVKGADSVMKNIVHESQQDFLEETCDNLAQEGLRTLVIACKMLSRKRYNDWSAKLKQAKMQLVGRDAAVFEVVQDIQHNLTMLGITGVEDQLQDQVRESVENIKKAGIKTWMLTGDKLETAKCISIGAGFKTQSEEFIELSGETEENELYRKIEDIQSFKELSRSVLLIDGVSLETAFRIKKKFLTMALECSSVICCRCAPNQKAQVVDGIKENEKRGAVLAIGDGGNDVGMIQQADIGIGIVGKEGKQAALASDFSLKEFKHIQKLILYHGRLAFRKSAVMAQFVIARGLTIACMQIMFIFSFFYVSLPIYNGILMVGYTSIFTVMPVFSLVSPFDVSLQLSDFPPFLTIDFRCGC